MAAFWLTPSRLDKCQEDEIEINCSVLGTEVTDKATGFKGTAISLYFYINGCTHFEVKPKGIIKKTGEAIKSFDFDIRRLKGKAIKELTDIKLKKDQKFKPSPEKHPVLKLR